MIRKLLIANRGEIACRIVRTCKRLGIKTVGIFSSSDRRALHTTLVDEAFCIGPGDTGEGYLNGDGIIEVALENNVDAIHPGYGFLSENHVFAQKCKDHGITFIGPSPEVIKAMGLKNEAVSIMAAEGIPVISGFGSPKQDEDTFLSLADNIGYPVILKAIAGGGGRGMRVVQSPGEMKAALVSAQRESLSAFGNDAMMIEEYIQSARHIEVQIIGDNFGNVVHLFERECSLQRRHQKVIEEAPALNLKQSVRKKLFEAAIRGGKGISYTGVGTFEFLVKPDGEFRFLEMNTRIQVEHPVTELITGLDIVELQIIVASGQPLPEKLKTIPSKGHAIEARIYSENADFTPSFGKLYCLGLPQESDELRIDLGVYEGDDITINYDSMIAKIISYGANREEALNTIYDGLKSLRIGGPSTNEEFLMSLISDTNVRSGDFDTKFIESNLKKLQSSQETTDELLAISVFALMSRTRCSQSIYSPWYDNSGWRLGTSIGREAKYLVNNKSRGYLLEGDTLTDLENKKASTVSGEWISEREFIGVIDEHTYTLEIYYDSDDYTVFWEGQKLRLKRMKNFQISRFNNQQEGSLMSPMPGVIVNVFVQTGQKIKAGAPLLVLEAMKTEHIIRSPYDGEVMELFFGEGEQVSEGVVLLGIQK